MRLRVADASCWMLAYVVSRCPSLVSQRYGYLSPLPFDVFFLGTSIHACARCWRLLRAAAALIGRACARCYDAPLRYSGMSPMMPVYADARAQRGVDVAISVRHHAGHGAYNAARRRIT